MNRFAIDSVFSRIGRRFYQRPFRFLLLSIFILGGCARSQIKSVDQAMRPVSVPSELSDDLGLFDLAQALQKNLERLKAYTPNTSNGLPVVVVKSGDPAVAPTLFLKFGERLISRDEYVVALELLIETLKADPSGNLYLKTLREKFEFHEVYGGDKWGEVFITSYFEPILQGRLKPQKPYTQPLYGIPNDMVSVNLAEFAKAFPALRPYQTAVIEQQSREGVLRGRIRRSGGEFEIQSIVPYFSRQEIDEDPLMKKKAPVICYVDPVDAFFLHIQGSGRVILPDNSEIRVGYAAQNGHPYKPIGKLLLDKIPKEQMSMQKIETHLRSLPEREARGLMYANPSYIFFQKRDTAPLGYFGAEVVPGRTIATDPKYFPKGALAYLEYEKPEFEHAEAEQPTGFKKGSRFVLDQDTGGAIRGPGRVDLFWGSGREAAQYSGVMRNSGRLYYILPKLYK